MPTIYLSPEDLSATQAAIILDYLNNKDDPAAMAERIELENELDIGIRLARRLIDAREKLGGNFENLQQVYDVAYIGPERFTEIAVALLGLNLPDSLNQSTSSYANLLSEITRLRQQIEQIQTRRFSNSELNVVPSRQIQLRVIQEDVFLGQHVTVEIYAFNTLGQSPLVDQPITLSTNWGVLQYQQGYNFQQDAVVEVRTDIEGRARVRLRSPTYETLTQEQQLALESALMQLDASAPTPEAIRAQLQNLVLSYRLETNLELRKAVDIYFNAQKVAILESVNHRFFSDNWQLHHALISAYLHESASSHDSGLANGLGNGKVETLSTVKVRLKDWVGAWYQTYLDYLENGEQFSQRVKDISSNSADGSRLINTVLSEMSRWALSEFGIAGSIIGEKSTEAAVRRFLADDIQDLPSQQQVQLYSALSVAVKPSAVTQVGTLQAVADTQLTLVDKITTQVGDVKDITTLAVKMQAQMDQFNSQFGTFQLSINQFNSDYANFNVGLTDFNNQYEGLDLRMIEIDTRLDTVNTNYEAVTSDIDTFNVSYTEYTNSLGSLRADIGNLKTDVRRIDSRVLGPNR